MPSVGTLNLTVESNASAVGSSLGELAGALERIKRAVPSNGLGLSSVATEIKSFVSTIKTIESSSTAFKSIESLGNGLVGIAKFLKYSTDSVKESSKGLNESMSTINTGPAVAAIKELKDQIGDGLHLGQAGTQLKNLRDALGGDWNVENAKSAGTALSVIGDGARALTGTSLATHAKNISAMAHAISEYAQSIEELKTAAGSGTAPQVVNEFAADGNNAGEGYAQGIREKIGEAKEAGADLAIGAHDSLADAQESHSPALAFIREGVYAAEGYIIGIQSKFTDVANALAAMTKTGIAAAGEGAPEAAKEVAIAIRSTVANIMSQVELPEAIKSGLMKVANETGNFVESYIGSSAKGGYETAAKIASNAVRTSLTSAMNGAAGTIEYKEGIQAVETEVAGVFKATEEPIKHVNSMLQEAKSNVEGMTNAFKPAKAIIKSTLSEFKKSEKNGTFASWMYGPRPMVDSTNTMGFQKGYETESERMAKNPQWYQPEEYYKRIAHAANTTQPQVKKLNDTIDEATSGHAQSIAFVDNLVENASEIDLFNMKIEDMTARLYEGVSAGTLSGEQIAGMVQQIQGYKAKVEELTKAQEEATSVAHKLSEAWQSLKSGVKNMFPTLTGLIKRFAQIAKYRMLRSVLRYITAGFTEGVKNVYQYSKVVGTDLAPAMDNAATALLQMKNSVGAAVAPVIQALVPVLQLVVSWIIKAFNYLNQFLALLNGQTTWTQAVESATTAYDDNANAAHNAAKAAKDLLADWDELNIIQSESGGGGGGTSQQNLPDYSSMFQEVSEYADVIKNLVDGIKEQFGSIWNLVKKVGIALLGWKFASAFSGALGLLGGIIAAGAITDIVFNLSLMFDKQYVKTGEEGWLIADFLTTALGAYLTGSVLKKFLGAGLATVAAGLTFAVSAGATFAVAENCEDEAKRNMLLLTGAIEAGIGTALGIAGFIAAGVSAPLAIAAGVISISLTAAISYSMAVAAEKAKEYKEMAEEAFTAVGEGGISADDYLAALQTKFDELTAGSKLTYEAYVEVPDLQDKLTTAVSQIEALNKVIFGDEKLTEEDAEAFKKNWQTILETLDLMNTKTYNTILSGLNDALLSANKDLAERAAELRVTFISIEKNVDTETAKLYKEIEDITNRIVTNTTQEGDLERYKVLMSSIAIMAGNGFDEIDEAMKKGDNIDFSDPEGSIEKAMAFVGDINKLVEEGTKAEQDALDAERNAIRMKKAEIDGLVKSGFITPEYAEFAKKQLDEAFGIFEKNSNTKLEEYEKYMNQAYSQVISQALEAAGNDPNKWRNIVMPLLEKMHEAGYEISDELMNSLQSGLSGNMSEVIGGWFTGSGARSAMKNLGVDDIVKSLNANMESALEKAKSNKSIPDYYLNVIDMFHLTGWDLLSADAVKEMYTQLVADLGNYKADLVMKGLGIELPEIDKKELEKSVEKVKEETEKLEKEREESVKKHGLRSRKYGLFGMYTPPTEEEEERIKQIKAPWESLSGNATNNGEWTNPFKGILDMMGLGFLSYTPPESETQSKVTSPVKGWQNLLGVNKPQVSYGADKTEVVPEPKVELPSDIYGKRKGWQVLLGMDDTNQVAKEATDEINEIFGQVQDAIFSSDSIRKNTYNEQIADMYANGKLAELKQLLADIESYGIDEAFKRIGIDATTGMNPVNFGNRSFVNPLEGTVGANKTYSDVGWTKPAETPSDEATIDYNKMSNSVRDGATSANAGTEALLRTIEMQLTRLLNKQWTVDVHPSSDWGRHNQRAGNMWNRASGENS